MNKNVSGVPVKVAEGYNTSLKKAPKIFPSLSFITKIVFLIPSQFLNNVLISAPFFELKKKLWINLNIEENKENIYAILLIDYLLIFRLDCLILEGI